MNRKTILIDAGHGGFNLAGEYTTPEHVGKKFHHFEAGKLHGDGWFYEGVGNRALAWSLAAAIINEGHIPIFTFNQYSDTQLKSRVIMANKVHSKNPDAVLLSLHSNAGGGKGYEIFTTKGQTRSDQLAEHIFKATRAAFLGRRFRTDTDDGDHDKEKNFYMLRRTTCPAVLIEHAFFDDIGDAKLLTDMKAIRRFTDATLKGVMMYFGE